MALIQQGAETLTVIVRGEGVIGSAETDEKDTAEKSPKQKDDEAKEEQAPVKKTSNRIKLINATHLMAASIAISKATLNYAIGDIAAHTGDKNFADRVQREVEGVNDGVDLLTSTAMTAWYGSRGGVWGAVIGGVIGFTTAATSKAFKYAGRERDYNIETFKMDNEINYARARANINWTNGRMR